MIPEKIKAIFGAEPPPGYMEQIDSMMQRAKAWRAKNPNTEALIVWPEKPLVIGGISDGINRRFVRTNPAGLELLKSMWDWDADTEPTITMCKVAMELSDL